MNKIQYIKLLELRGITKLVGMTIGGAVKSTGGDPTEKEMVEVNRLSMIHYIGKYEAEVKVRENLELDIKKLHSAIDDLNEISDFMDCLDACGVDNWCGYDEARRMQRKE